MRKRLILILTALCVVAYSNAQLHADSFPHYTIYAMCDMAELIVEGKYVGDNRVEITHIHKASEHLPHDAREIEVVDLDKHDRRLWRWSGAGKDRTIETNRVVLFLLHQPKENKWRPVAGIGSGSCGVFWYDDARCYGYAQAMNPGDYVLLSGENRLPRNRIPKNIDALRPEVKTGLENAARWQLALAIEDPEAKAKALAAYLMKRTAPGGDVRTYSQQAIEHIREVAGYAVPTIIEMLENRRPEDDLSYPVAALGLAGPAAKPAVPLLCTLLESPGRVALTSVFHVLERAGDPKAIQHVRPFLQHDNFRVACSAGRALAAFNDVESFDDIAGLALANMKKKHQYDVRDLLKSLHALDPKRARPIIERAAKHPGLPDVKWQIDNILKRGK